MTTIRNIAGRLSTETCYIRNLIQDIAKGEIKIPKFQRKFVWSVRQTLDLLDSIAHNYPIGSILLWKTNDKLVEERDIGEFRLPKTDDITPTNYVLDGQQRLTVIYSYLGAPVGAEGLAAAYDLYNDQFVEYHNNKTEKQESMFELLFPLRYLFDIKLLLDFRASLQHSRDHDALQQKLDSLIGVFTNYQVPVVTLKDLTVEEVCPIFERINSSGTKLSTYDLMVAATWSHKFDLNDQTEKILDSLRPKGFDDIKGDTIIKCLTAIQFNSIYRDDILKLRELDSFAMRRLVNQTENAILHSVDILSTELKVHSLDFLPYEAILVTLCSIFADPNIRSLNPQQLQRIREWFWRSSFNERYRGASDTLVSSDIKYVSKYVITGAGSSIEFGDAPSASILRNSIFRSNNARSRAFSLLLAGYNPRDLINGTSIDTNEALSTFNRKQFHHIYPKDFLKKAKLNDSDSSLINICLITASSNRNISNQNPNEYLPSIIYRLGGNSKMVFESNLLPGPSVVNYGKLDYTSFLDQRAEIIYRAVSNLCRGECL